MKIDKNELIDQKQFYKDVLHRLVYNLYELDQSTIK